jgi:hypothetical protein
MTVVTNYHLINQQLQHQSFELAWINNNKFVR